MDLITTFQNLIAEVPQWAQPLITALAGAVPFIEGEGGATIGIIGGINPFIAAISAGLGNFICVAVLVWLSAGARKLVVDRFAERTTAPATATAGVSTSGSPTLVESRPNTHPEEAKSNAPASKQLTARQIKFQRALSRYGVPGVSLLGPLLLPTQFTASMLAAAGVERHRVLLWQGLAIALWTTVIAVLITQVFNALPA